MWFKKIGALLKNLLFRNADTLIWPYIAYIVQSLENKKTPPFW